MRDGLLVGLVISMVACQSAPSLSQARTGAVAIASSAGEVFVTAGSNTGYSPLHSVERGDVGSSGFSPEPGVVLQEARNYPGAALIGSYFYVFSGLKLDPVPQGAATSNTVERAEVRADGTLGPFTILPGVTIKTPRYAAVVAVSNSWVYLLGGANENGNILSDIERAPIDQSNGSIGDFIVDESKLSIATAYAAGGAVGGFAYVIGGRNTDPIADIQRSAIGADGSLSTFQSAGALPLPRAYAGTAIVGDSVFVVGGSDGTDTPSDVVSATIDAGGTLGVFSNLSNAVWSLRTPRVSPAIAVVDRTVLTIGGYDANTKEELRSVERTTLPAR